MATIAEALGGDTSDFPSTYQITTDIAEGAINAYTNQGETTP